MEEKFDLSSSLQILKDSYSCKEKLLNHSSIVFIILFSLKLNPTHLFNLYSYPSLRTRIILFPPIFVF